MTDERRKNAIEKSLETDADDASLEELEAAEEILDRAKRRSAADRGLAPKRKASDHWMTPTGTVNRSFSVSAFTKLNSVFHFQVDAAADTSNHLCDVWFGPGSPVELFDSLDATADDWRAHGSRFFLNPPLSQQAGPLLRWIRKANEVAEAGPALVVAVVPAATSWNQFVDGAVHCPRFFSRARIRFVPPPDLETKNPRARHDSMVLLFVGDLHRDGVWL